MAFQHGLHLHYPWISVFCFSTETWPSRCNAPRMTLCSFRICLCLCLKLIRKMWNLSEITEEHVLQFYCAFSCNGFRDPLCSCLDVHQEHCQSEMCCSSDWKLVLSHIQSYGHVKVNLMLKPNLLHPLCPSLVACKQETHVPYGGMNRMCQLHRTSGLLSLWIAFLRWAHLWRAGRKMP